MFVFLRWILYRETLFTCVLLYELRPRLCNSKQIVKQHRSKSWATLTDEREKEETESRWFKESWRISCSEWVWNKITGYFRESFLFKLSMTELWIIRPHYLHPGLYSSCQRLTHVLCTSLQVQTKIICKFYLMYNLKIPLRPSQPAASLTLPRLFWVPYSVWINGHCLKVCLCGLF